MTFPMTFPMTCLPPPNSPTNLIRLIRLINLIRPIRLIRLIRLIGLIRPIQPIQPIRPIRHISPTPSQSDKNKIKSKTILKIWKLARISLTLLRVNDDLCGLQTNQRTPKPDAFEKVAAKRTDTKPIVFTGFAKCDGARTFQTKLLNLLICTRIYLQWG